MNFIKKISISFFVICALLLSAVQTCFAAGMTITAGQSTVSVGKTVAFTVTIPADAKVWLYSIEYSDNLTLESPSSTVVEGYYFDPGTRVTQFVFRAKSVGTATVRIASGSYGDNIPASGSASVTVIAANKPDSGEPTPSKPGVSRSSNNALSSLTVSAGELTPAFDPAVTEYTLSLPVQSDKLTVTATPSDSKATVEGSGEVTLQGGENQVAVVVTAENGDTKTYTITVKVAQAPTLFLIYYGQRLGVVKDIDGVVAPAGFSAAEPIAYEGDSLPIWVNAAGDQTLVYLVSEGSSDGVFYLYSQSDGLVLSPYIPLAGGTLPYVYTGIPAELAAMPGLTPGSVVAFGTALDGWTYDDPAMKDFYVLYLMNADGIYGYYTYDSAKDTLQRFNGAVYADNGDSLRIPMLYVYIAGGAAAVLLILVIVLACVSGSRGKKLHALNGGDLPQTDENEATDNGAEADTEPEEPQEVPEEVIAEPQPETENAPGEQAESEALEEAEMADEAESDPEEPTEEPAPGQPEELPDEEAPNEETDKTSLEDTLRHLPLDELLRDVHDL